MMMEGKSRKPLRRNNDPQVVYHLLRTGALLLNEREQGRDELVLVRTVPLTSTHISKSRTRTPIPDQTQGCSWAGFDPPGARSSSRF
jgi:hypothetical protein